MNKRYIDFVPSGQKKAVKSTSTTKSSVFAAKGADLEPYRAMPQSGAGAARQRTSVAARSRAQARVKAAPKSGTRMVAKTGARVVKPGARATQIKDNAQTRAQMARARAQATTKVVAQPSRSAQPAQPEIKTTAKSVVYESRTVQYGPSGLSIDEGQTLGVIENLNEKFVSKDVEKRPLSDGKPLPEKDLAKEAKSKRLLGRRQKKDAAKTPVENSVEKSSATEVKKTYTVPKSPFINQEKVVKRPLSKNVYAKKAEPSKEEHGPVTIIAKPEKDSRIGIVVAVILIIILGAAAGTVAFLLLPK